MIAGATMARCRVSGPSANLALAVTAQESIEHMSLPDFTDNEYQLVNQILLERYNRIVPLQAVEVELLLKPEDKMQPTPCPALYWSELGR
jgi:hypothetical protein